MGNRIHDWLKQADADLSHSRNALKAGDFEWSCFAAQQAAEKAVKALFLKLGMDAREHAVSILLGNLPQGLQVTEALLEGAKTLDKHYILARYPSGFDAGAPTDFYTKREGEGAIDCAAAIIEFCRHQIHRS